MGQVFFDKKKAKYYYVLENNETVGCSHCSVTIDVGRVVVLQKSYSKKEFIKYFWCMDCMKHHKKQIYDEFITLKVADYIPSNTILVLEFKPSLRNRGDETVFSAAEKQLEGEKLDKGTASLLSFDPNRNIRCGDYHDANLDFIKREQFLSGDPKDKESVLAILHDLRDATPLVLENEGKKLLEKNGGD